MRCHHSQKIARFALARRLGGSLLALGLGCGLFACRAGNELGKTAQSSDAAGNAGVSSAASEAGNGNVGAGGSSSASAAGSAGAAVAQGNCPAEPNYTLVWADDFSGTTLDASKWNFEVNCDGGGNNEAECYVKNSNNLFLQDGIMTIRLLKGGASGGKSYSSSRINSQNKGDFRFGKILVRSKVPKGQGLWPAFWMMPTQSVYGPWPTSGEIDIMEILGSNPSKLFGTPHFGTVANHLFPGGTFALPSGDFSQDFHEYAVEWNANQIAWSVDGNQYHVLKATDNEAWQTSTGKWPFDQKFYVILNMAIGGGFGGTIDPAITQADYQVDHVCIYQ